MSSANTTEKLSFDLLADTDSEAREAAKEYINKLL